VPFIWGPPFIAIIIDTYTEDQYYD